jgi:hypothetical protein
MEEHGFIRASGLARKPRFSPSSSLSPRFYRFSGVKGPEIVESVGALDEKANVVQTYPLEARPKP